MREEGGLTTRLFTNIRSVKASAKGRIVVVHGEGVAAVEPELVPESFLQAWGISVEGLRQAQRLAEEARVQRMAVHRAIPQSSFSWLALPLYPHHQRDVVLSSLPWGAEDESTCRRLTSSGEISLGEGDFPWMNIGQEQALKNFGLQARAVMRMDSRLDTVVTISSLMTDAAILAKSDDDWLEALPRVEPFDVWRDVWSEFPFVEVAELRKAPADYLDDMVRVRGLFGMGPNDQPGESFTLLSTGAQLTVRYGSLVQAAAIKPGLVERLSALRALPRNFSREITIIGECTLDASGQPVLDLIDVKL